MESAFVEVLDEWSGDAAGQYLQRRGLEQLVYSVPD